MCNCFVEKWWFVLPLYLLGGVILGLADPALGQWATQQFGVKPGLATAASVNVLLPLFAIALAALCPRLTTAVIGGIGMAAAYTLGLAINYPPPAWDAATFLASVKPVLVMACIGYVVVGSVAVLVLRAVEKADGYDARVPAA